MTEDVVDSDPLVSCPYCGRQNDATVRPYETTVPHLTLGEFQIVVSVWTCHACDQSWTGHRTEAQIDAFVAAMLEKGTR